MNVLAHNMYVRTVVVLPGVSIYAGLAQSNPISSTAQIVIIFFFLVKLLGYHLKYIKNLRLFSFFG